MSITFRRGTVRDYFAICPEGTCFERVKAAGLYMMSGAWGYDAGNRPIVSKLQVMEGDKWTGLL